MNNGIMTQYNLSVLVDCYRVHPSGTNVYPGILSVQFLDQGRLRPLHDVLPQAELAGVSLTQGQH